MKNINFKLSKITSLIMFISLFIISSNAYSIPIDKNAAKQIALKKIMSMRKSRGLQDSQNSQKVEISFEMEGEDQTFYVFNMVNMTVLLL